MARFDVNTKRFDPYLNYKFRVRLDGRIVAGFSEVTAFRPIEEMVEYFGGVEPSTLRKVPAGANFDGVLLKRGVTHDAEFVKWANTVCSSESEFGVRTASNGHKKIDIVIDVFNEAGQLAPSYAVQGCWMSKLQAAPDVDTNANALAIETMRLEHEGCECDFDVTVR